MLDRQQHLAPGLPKPPGIPASRTAPRRRPRLGRVALVLALAVVAAGVAAAMQTRSLAQTREDLGAAHAKAERLHERIESTRPSSATRTRSSSR